MKFDENGNLVTSVHKMYKMHHKQNTLVVDLESRYPGLSDRSVKILLDMVRGDNVERINELLSKLNGLMK